MDPITTAALIGGGSSLLGGLFQNNSARSERRISNRFTERMSNTSYQRGMADMKTAGLNPILAYQRGGASSPGGTAAPVVNPMAGAGAVASSAISSRRTIQELKNMSSVNDNLEKDYVKKHYEINLLNEQVQSARAVRENTEMMNRFMKTKLPGLKTEEKIDESRYGEALRYLQRANPLGSTAKDLKYLTK